MHVNTTHKGCRHIKYSYSQVLCLCMCFAIHHSQCSFPLHTFLTDAIETCGGSSRLIKLLNRLGICTSADTHARYVQYRVEGALRGES